MGDKETYIANPICDSLGQGKLVHLKPSVTGIFATDNAIATADV